MSPEAEVWTFVMLVHGEKPAVLYAGQVIERAVEEMRAHVARRTLGVRLYQLQGWFCGDSDTLEEYGPDGSTIR